MSKITTKLIAKAGLLAAVTLPAYASAAAMCGAPTTLGYDLTLGKTECVSGNGAYFYLDVEKDNSNIEITTTGGEGEVDIFVNPQQWATQSQYSERTDSAGTEEKLVINANKGRLYISLFGIHQGVTLDLVESKVIAPDPDDKDKGESCTGVKNRGGYLALEKQECVGGNGLYYYVEVEEDNTELTITTRGGTGEADIFVNKDFWATRAYHVASSENPGTDETLRVMADKGYFYISLLGANDAVTLTVNQKAGGTKPTEEPKPTDVPTQDPKPTDVPTADPKPTDVPTADPKPTDVPTADPKPTDVPTEDPKPTDVPTADPKPTDVPTEDPKPSNEPTPNPDDKQPDPTFEPTPNPDEKQPDPTDGPTQEPTPTDGPTKEPTPTDEPTKEPNPGQFDGTSEKPAASNPVTDAFFTVDTQIDVRIPAAEYTSSADFSATVNEILATEWADWAAIATANPGVVLEVSKAIHFLAEQDNLASKELDTLLYFMRSFAGNGDVAGMSSQSASAMNNAFLAVANMTDFHTTAAPAGLIQEGYAAALANFNNANAAKFFKEQLPHLNALTQFYATLSNPYSYENFGYSSNQMMKAYYDMAWYALSNADLKAAFDSQLLATMSAVRSYALAESGLDMRWDAPADRGWIMAHEMIALASFAKLGNYQLENRVDSLIREIVDAISYNVTEDHAKKLVTDSYLDTLGRSCDGDALTGYCAIPKTIDEVLTIKYSCNDKITIRAEAMTQAQLQTACQQMAKTDSAFHSFFETNYEPVPYDYNTQLEVVVYATPASYAEHGYNHFGIDVDNGGIYIEGNPAQAGNIPRFFAKQCPSNWVGTSCNVAGEVYNLEHEYIHYLDARYNLYGRFAHHDHTVSWAEGWAEYLTKGDYNKRNYDAIQGLPVPSLRSILFTAYGFNNLYPWSHYTMRFLAENHKSDVLALANALHNSDSSEYKRKLDEVATNYGDEFIAWMVANTGAVAPAPATKLPVSSCAMAVPYTRSNSSAGVKVTNTTSTPVNLYYIDYETGDAYLDNNYKTLYQGDSYEADYWTQNDRLMITDTNNRCLGVANLTTPNNLFEVDASLVGGTQPSPTPTPTPTPTPWPYPDCPSSQGIMVTCEPTPDPEPTSEPTQDPRPTTEPTSAPTTEPEPTVEPTAEPNPNPWEPIKNCTSVITESAYELDPNKKDCVTASGALYFMMTVPWNESNVTLGLIGGTGDAKLYVNPTSGAWPSAGNAELSSESAGTTQSVQFTADMGQQVMIMLAGDFENVTFSRLTQSEVRPTPTPTPKPCNPDEDICDKPDLWATNCPERLNDFKVSAYNGLSGYQMVDYLKSINPDHISPLFNLKSGQLRYILSENNLQSAISELGRYSSGVTPENACEVNNLMYFVRSAFFHQFFNPELLDTYSASVKVNLEARMKDLFNAPGIMGEHNDQALALGELFSLTDGAEIRAPFYDDYIKVLNAFDETWAINRNRVKAANDMMTAFFRAAQQGVNGDAEFIAKATDGRLFQALKSFQENNRYLLKSKYINEQYIIGNSVSMLGDYLGRPETKDMVKPMIRDIIAQTSKDDETNPLWVKAAGKSDYYDRIDCGYYNVCGFAHFLEREILSFNYKCNERLKIRAEHMFNEQAAWACKVLEAQEEHFHQKLNTYHTPVPDDKNETLELVVFKDKESYGNYLGIFWGYDSNNGGLYIEGTPEADKNQARFFAYEQSYGDYFHIWNLQHEYVHYLDGRYNLWGDFALNQTVDSIWWSEGLGEYISYQDGNNIAIDLAQRSDVALSTIFKNQYADGLDRVYRWGYLAVRFMHERHPNDVREILRLTRAGKYSEYQTYMDNIGSRYDSEFRSWTKGLTAGETAIVEEGPSDTVSEGSGQGGNWEGEPVTIDTDFTPCVASNPANKFDPDNTEITIGSHVIECMSPSTSSANYVFANDTGKPLKLRITTTGGWGNADIAYKADAWPTLGNADAKSINDGNTESIDVVVDANIHWHYFSVMGKFGGVNMTVELVE